MAEHLAVSGQKIRTLRFNLSQLGTRNDLVRAFQRVRDLTISEGKSLVFWDEFDSSLHGETLAWLASFLAPMQDGEFTEDGLQRPIGPAIFVFAGGTHPSFESFRKAVAPRIQEKAPDFLSRLRGYIDILGPNPTDDNEEAYVLRRGLLLRSVLERKAPGLIDDNGANFDGNVLRALLRVSEYKHGARSMEAIVDMSTLAGKTRFDRSCLPARDQLSLHVDADEFLSICAGDEPFSHTGRKVWPWHSR
jgi:hypothetical protein